MDKHKYARAVQHSAHSFLQAILSEDGDEASTCLARSSEELLQALNLCGATVELDGQQFMRRCVLERIGDEILDEVRKRLFAVVLPRVDGDLKLEIVDAFEAMQRRFRELTLPVLH
jgi:hypothetical protein